jgi:hypothetical protein
MGISNIEQGISNIEGIGIGNIEYRTRNIEYRRNWELGIGRLGIGNQEFGIGVL